PALHASTSPRSASVHPGRLRSLRARRKNDLADRGDKLKRVHSSWGFGIVRASEVSEAGRPLLTELCARATDATSIAFHPVVTTSSRELLDALERGDLGVAWLPPLPAIAIEERRVGTVLAVPMRHGTTSYHSALIVRRGGPKLVEELRGRRAAWVQRDSA